MLKKRHIYWVYMMRIDSKEFSLIGEFLLEKSYIREYNNPMINKEYPVAKPFIRLENLKRFWTEREYKYQNLIINGFIVQREKPGFTKKTIPHARVDIFYDSPEGIGIKKINGVEFTVWKEAIKYLSAGEREELNRQWIKAKYSGKYDWLDPLCKKDLTAAHLPDWIQVKDGKAIEIEFKHKTKNTKTSPIKDIFLTQDIDPKKVTKDGVSTLYKHIKGDLELTKGKAIEYGKTIGVPPASLMFNPKMVTVWTHVNLTNQVILPHHLDKLQEGITPEIHPAGHCYLPNSYETVICPTEIYRIDVKAVKVESKNSIYDGFVAYYYGTNKVSDTANNKLCLVREFKNKDHKYYLGIYQIYGTKKRVLNVDPTADVKVIVDDVNPDLVAPIVSFTKEESLEADKIVLKDISQISKLNELMKEEEKHRFNKEKQKQLILSAADKVMSARKTSQKNLETSERLVRELEIKQKAYYDEMRNLIERVSIEQDRKAAERQRFSLDKLIRGNNAVELPDHYELPKVLAEQKDSLSKIFEQFRQNLHEDNKTQARKTRGADKVA